MLRALTGPIVAGERRYFPMAPNWLYLEQSCRSALYPLCKLQCHDLFEGYIQCSWFLVERRAEGEFKAVGIDQDVV